jgi:subtilisin family serine protease
MTVSILRHISTFIAVAVLGACASSQQTARQPAAEVPSQPAAPTPGDSLKLPYLPPWNFMSLSTAGIDTFLIEHPSYDGRGVVVLIFDTGVDMSITGLQQTTTSLPKVIDAIDFSRSNVLRFKPARIEGSGNAAVATAQGVPVRLKNVVSIKPQPVDGAWYIGCMDESLYRNSTVRDFDGDGASKSKFGALLYRASDGWRVILDTDADSSMADEVSVGTYRERRETFQFRQSTPEMKSPLTVAANIDAAKKEAGFHYDMDVHGTHVAGIATGFGINGEAGFNGVAPGAQVISGKFSADTAKDITITGSMRHAYEFAGRLADSLARSHTPVVVNMSFGIGSAIEGRAEIEQFIDETIARHPNLYVCTSAGNEGPGLSTVGIPGGASRVITVGALLPRGVGRDTYSASLGSDILWDFSSRGGELDKPDVVAPGTAVSTITRFSYESRLSGTSMASPYTTGVVALLLSAFRQEDSTWIPTQALIRRALRNSAMPLAGYAPIEQGGGVINVRRAYQLLKSYRRSGFADDMQEYLISTYSPNFPDDRGPTAFWRSAYVPGDDWRQTFTITRLPSAKPATGEFFRAFTLEPTAPWLKTIEQTVYIRNEGSAQIDVLYDREKMKEPGLYSAKILARRASSRGEAARENVEFELVNTVIVPYLFSPQENFTVTTPAQKVAAGGSKRFYLAPPEGAAALTFTLSVPKGSRSNVSGTIVDRNGYTASYLAHAKGTERNEGSNTVAMSTLGDGVIEVVVKGEAFEGAGEASEFTLSVSALMLDLKTEARSDGTSQDLKITALNGGTQTMNGSLAYTLKGYTRVLRDTMHGDTFSMPIVLRKQDGAVWITPRFSAEDYSRATDIIARLVDASGSVQAEETYNKPWDQLFLPNFYHDVDSTVYTLQILFGAASDANLPATPIEITESHVHPSDPHALDSYGGTELVPYIPQTFSAKLPAEKIPRGFQALGEVSYKPRGEDQAVTWEFVVPK